MKPGCLHEPVDIRCRSKLRFFVNRTATDLGTRFGHSAQGQTLDLCVPANTSYEAEWAVVLTAICLRQLARLLTYERALSSVHFVQQAAVDKLHWGNQSRQSGRPTATITIDRSSCGKLGHLGCQLPPSLALDKLQKAGKRSRTGQCRSLMAARCA